ncbi:MAG: TonB-dependent receptor domain-containing protein, partial [Candidatus Kryptoniota bacterium]
LWDWWNDFSNKLIAEGPDSVLAKVLEFRRIGFVPDFYRSSANNQDIRENYYAGYLMSRIDFGNLIMFLPGVRYERVTDDMVGNFVYDISQVYSLLFPRAYQKALHKDEFFLPMISLRLKPSNWMSFILSYTKTLGRPSFIDIVPNTFVNNGVPPYVYRAGNPDLKPEQWTSYDLQVAFYNNEIGLFSIDGFYKEVNDKIWERTYTRIKGDPVIPGFKDISQVIVTEAENHKYPVYLKGLELEWQTNFWYLPAPLSYFSLNFNYTIINSETKYPTMRMYTTYQNDSLGRPVPTLHRVDSVVTGRMLYQPSNIANISLGFNYKGLNIWLSYQFNGSTMTSWSNQPEMIGLQNSFQLWDLQIAQALPIEGLSLQFNLANISNEEQDSKLQGDPRLTYAERFGWTGGLGIRYSF